MNIIRPRKFITTNHQFNYNNNNNNNNNGSIFKIQHFKDHDYIVKVPNEQNRFIKKTQGKNSLKKSIWLMIENYCDKSSLHGLRYIGDESLSIGERIFWAIAFIMAVSFAAYYISNIYEKWQMSPVIISISPFDAHLTSIPFPAITICNMNQATKMEAEKILKNGTYVEKKILDDLCNRDDSFNETSTDIPDWSNVRDFLVKVGQSCSDILRACIWKGNKVNCDDFFNNDLTDDGLCCSFNRLPPNIVFRNPKDVTILNQTYPDHVYDWSPERGFIEADTGDDSWVPRRPLGAGTHLGLTLILDAKVDYYYCSATDSVGFKVLLSNPIETPKISDFGFFISVGYEMRISIDPSIRQATDALRDIAVKKRQCYFANERPLVHYRTYTQMNCKLECQSNYTLNLCQCIPYYLPKNTKIKICGQLDEECAAQAKADMELTIGNGSSCDCLPGCFEMSFSKSASFSKLSSSLKLKEGDFPLSSDYILNNLAVVHFYFKDSVFRRQIKSELYGFTEVLSNVGGLLGLCLGFSFLSFIELIYFVIKIIFKLIQSNKIKQNNLQIKQPKYPFLK